MRWLEMLQPLSVLAISACILLAAAILLDPDRGREARIYSGAWFFVGLGHLFHNLLHSEALRSYPACYPALIGPLFFVGPFVCQSFRMVLGDLTRPLRNFHWHLAPGFLLTAALLPTLFDSPAGQSERVDALLGADGRPRYLEQGVYTVVYLAYRAYSFIYMILATIPFLRALRREDLRENHSVRVVLWLLVFLNLLIVAAIVGAVYNSKLIALFNHRYLSALLLGIIAVARIYPETLEDFASLLREKAGYRSSHLGRVDLAGLHRALDRLFETERIHLESDLNLERLADRLALNRHQLSEFLNVHLEKTFAELVSERRIAYAKHLLMENPRLPIARVGQACGYDSRSTFHLAFRKFAGMSPSEYRKRAG